MLGIEDNEYPEYSNFKQRIIKPAVEQISKITDLYCEFEEIKNKRKVEKIRFKFVKQHVNFNTKEQLSFLENEVAITSCNDDYNVVKEFRDLLGITIGTKQIEKLIKLSSASIKKFKLDVSIKEYIKQKKIVVDEYGKKKTIGSYLGAIIRAIENNWTITTKEHIDNFNNFGQRNYDFDALERGLLGWNSIDEGDEVAVDYVDTPFEDVE